MNIVWTWSLQSEAERILEMSLKVGNGFYHLHHFLPLPFDPHHTYPNPSHHVYLPALPYTHIPRYWEYLSRLDEYSYSYDSPQLQQLIHPLLTHLTTLNLAPLDLASLQSTANALLPKVIDWLHSTFPNLPLPKRIKIHPTYFGTGGSFNWTSQGEVILYLRADQDIYTLVEILLSAILRPHAGTTLYSDWEKTEYLVDYLLLESSLHSLLPPTTSWTPTTIPPHYPKSLIDQSTRFLAQLGITNVSTSHFTHHDGQIYFGDTPLSGLTQREGAIMQKLIELAPRPASTDQIADLIFTAEDKFSLAAIGKTIERLRKKLSRLGISSSYIATASGVGYYLKY